MNYYLLFFIGLLIILLYYKKYQQEYNENGNEKITLFDKLKTIKSNNFEMKGSYNSVIPLNIFLVALNNKSINLF